MSDGYVPAAGHAAFTRLYDPVMALTMRESRWRGLLVDEAVADLPASGTAIEIGTGTGALALAIARARSDAQTIAIDGDAEVLSIARRKPGADVIDWRLGLAGALPLEDAVAHVVVMSLLLHHLDSAAKARALAEVVRVLRPGGVVLIADWGRPRDLLTAAGFVALRALDGFGNTRDHARGRLPQLIADAGLVSINLRARVRTAWGSLELLHAQRP